MCSFIGAMAQSNADQRMEGMKASDLRTGERLGARVSTIARRLVSTRLAA